jgi:tRNA threonylcarbamoyladenosine biosynthesis protein TsaE
MDDMTDSFVAHAHGADGTARIAASLAARLRPGDVVLLTGDLASGKTTFVKAVAEALGATDVVTSPTFTLAQFYKTPTAPILHVDTYRLGDVAEYRDLGLDDFVATSISLIEWGELVAGEFVAPLTVYLRVGASPEDREIAFAGAGRWAEDLTALCDELSGVRS